MSDQEVTTVEPEAAEQAASSLEPQFLEIGDPEIQVRDLAKREIDMRIVPWNTAINTVLGPEVFEPGAFDGVDLKKVRLMGLEHEAHFGIGQDGQPKLIRKPTGKAIALESRADGAYATFRVSQTAAGDEQLALAADGVADGASVEFVEIPGGTRVETRSGRRTRIHQRVDLRAVSTTYRPAYAGAQVLAVRSTDEAADSAPAQGVAVMAEDQAAVAASTEAPDAAPAAAPGPMFDVASLQSALAGAVSGAVEPLVGRLGALEERARSAFEIPTGEPEKPKASRGDWMRTVLGMLSGDRVSQHDLQTRALQDIITTDNIGVVPDAFSTELIGVIDPRRPFMNSTRRLNTPAAGMSLVLPKITQRPTVAEQMTEKSELSSQKTTVTTATFDAVSKGGAGDISLQLLKRSDPSFLDLYLELLAEAYAQESEQEAVEALLAAGVNSGGAMDPESLTLASAFEDTFTAVRRTPDTIWLSSAAVGEFIDAKAAGTNAPLYSQITANFTAGGGVGGSISGLRAVHVPALDATDSDVIVGPSTGFAWAEDGTYTLQVDVPAKAGRDVAIIGMLWFAPLYPAAFTVYSVSSGGS